MSHVIVTLDVIDIDRLQNPGPLIKIEHVAMKIRVITDPAKVALEMPIINDVEPDQRAKEPPVGFDDAVTEQETVLR